MITLGMTRPIPSSRYSFCPISSRPGLTNHGLCSIIAKTALGNSRRIIELQTPHFANPSESHTCKLPGDIGPKFSPNVRMVSPPAIAPSIRGRARMEDSTSQATRKVGRGPAVTTTRQRHCASSAKTMPLRPIESVRLNVSRSGLRDGRHCILSCFLGVVASCTASRTQLLGSPLFLPPAERSAGSIQRVRALFRVRAIRVRAVLAARAIRGAGCTWSPCNNYLNFRAPGFCGANFTNEG
jgi:hypothetical protein